jgi:hypothetical protein
MISSIHQYASMAAAFAGSLVEAVEALTIVLAVGTVRGWRSALSGALLGFGALFATAAIFGPAIARTPIHALQIVIGTLLLLFGVRWLRKAILRSAGVIALHDEDIAFAREMQAIGAAGDTQASFYHGVNARLNREILQYLRPKAHKTPKDASSEHIMHSGKKFKCATLSGNTGMQVRAPSPAKGIGSAVKLLPVEDDERVARFSGNGTSRVATEKGIIAW